MFLKDFFPGDNPEGKGLYPIFAIGTHYCICNSRYSLDPQTRHMYVRARMLIPLGDEISVQYLSALYGNFKRRKKIKDEWYFDCTCRRCSGKPARRAAAVPPPCRAKVSMPKIYFKHFQILLKEEPSLVQLSVQIVAQETCYLKIR